MNTIGIGKPPFGTALTRGWKYLLLCARDDHTKPIIDRTALEAAGDRRPKPDLHACMLGQTGNPRSAPHENDDMVTMIDVPTCAVVAAQ